MNRKQNQKSGNKGFTLVELLVGVSMLALITVPLITMFYQSMNTSARSAEIGDSTLLAENITEQLEVVDLESWYLNPTLRVGGGYVTGNRDATSTTETAIYHFGNIDIGTSEFNATVTIDATAFSGVNDVWIAQYTPMDLLLKQDIDGDNPDKQSWDDFVTYALPLMTTTSGGGVEVDPEAGGEPPVADPALEELLEENTERRRDISVVIEEEEGLLKITAEYEYRYEYEEPTPTPPSGETPPIVTTTPVAIVWPPLEEPEEDPDAPPPDPDEEPSDSEVGVYVIDERATSGLTDEAAVYFMFYPWYFDGNDEIKVTNESDLDITLFVVKRADPDESDLNSKENKYNAKNNTVKVDGTNLNGEVNVYTNIEQPIQNFTSFVRPGGSALDSDQNDLSSLVVHEQVERTFEITVDIYNRLPDGTSDNTDGPAYSFTTTNLQ